MTTPNPPDPLAIGQDVTAASPRWSLGASHLCLALALAVVLAGLAMVWHQRWMHRQGVELRLSAILDAGQAAVDQWTRARLDHLLAWAADPGLVALAREPLGAAVGPGGQANFPGLPAARAAFPDLAGAALVSRQHRNLASLDQGRLGAVNSLADQGGLLHQVFSGQALVSPQALAPSPGQDHPAGPRLILAAPVDDGTGRVIAALVMVAAPQAEAHGLLGAWRLGPGEGLLAFDHAGRVIARSSDPPAASAPQARLDPDLLPAIRRGKLLEHDAPGGQRRLVMARWLPGLNLGLAVEFSSARASRALDPVTWIIGAGAGLALVLVLMLWLWHLHCQRQAGLQNQKLSQANALLSQEVDRCRLAEDALTASQRRYQTLLDNANDMVLAATIDREHGPGAIVEVNQAACRVLGYQRAEMIGLRVMSLVQPFNDLRQTLARLWADGALVTETQLVAKDGRLVPVEASVHLMELEGRQVVLAQLRDIGDRLQAQRELREREVRLQAIVDGFEGFVYICSADHRLEFVNERLRRHLGRDAVGEPCFRAVHGSQAPCRWCADGTVLGGQTVREEIYSRRDQRWYYSVLSPLVHPDGRVSKHGMMLDITARERARRDLAEQEGLLRSVLGSLPAHIAVLNPAGFVIAVNQAWEEFGQTARVAASQVGVGVNYLQVVDEAAKAGDMGARAALEGIQGVLGGQRPSFQQEYPCHTPGGPDHWFLMTVSPLDRPKGGVVISHLEVTERVEAERAMQESQARYRSLVEELPLAVAIVQQGRIVFANPQAGGVFGLADSAALLGADPLTYVAPQDRDRMAGILQALEGDDARPQRLEALLRRGPGQEFPAEIHGVRLEFGDRPATQFVISDITERRRAEQTIGVLARIPEESPNPMVRVTSQGVLLYANPAARPLLESWDRKVGDPLPETWLPALGEAISQGQNQSYEVRLNGRYLVFMLAPVPEAGYLNLYGVDVTESRRYEQRLAASEANYRAVFNAVADAIFIHDANDGAILDVNQAAVDLYGYAPQEARRLDVGALSSGPPYYGQEQALEKIMLAVAGQPQVFEWQARKKDGSLFWAEVSLKRATIGGNDRLLGLVRDISERRQAQEQIQLLAKVFENTIEGITVTDTRGTIQMVNPGFSHITGYTAAEVMGRNPRMLKSDRHDPDFYAVMWRGIVETGHWSGEIWNRRKSGEAYPEWLTISIIKDSLGQPTHYVALFHDITEIKRSEEKIKHQAYHDALTGLPNRQLFNDRLEVALARAQRGHESLAIMFLDLDHFKTINDSLGHAVGDLLLQEVAQRLKNSVRQEDTVSRLGGDEFIMILPEVGGADEAVAAAGRIIEALEKSFHLRGHDLYVTSSIGITVYPNDGQDLETLVKNADMAMYLAKEQGRNTYRLFTPAMNQRARRRQELLTALRRAVERDEFLVHYQPQVALGSGRVVGVEALARWQPPEGELVPPNQFIPLAEETGLILPIGQRVLEIACRQAAAWARAGHDQLRLAVNLSARQFNQPDLVGVIAATLADTGLAPGQLELEITESTVMANLDATSEILKRLHARGMSLALDDFGTGHSSLSYLRRFAIDVLKIDRSFIKDLASDPDAATITEAIVSMAHTLRLKVIAEGVETPVQLEFLRTLGCDYVQGFLFSRPLSAADLTRLLQSGATLSPV